MQGAAQVKSIEALEGFRAALGLFASDVDQALADIQAHIARFVDWLEHDQLSYWRQEIRLRDDQVAQAKADLHRCMSATIDPHRTPSCYQEKKILDAAKRRYEEAERKLAAVRRWIPLVRQALLEYRLKIEPLEGAIAADLPRAAAFLQSSVARLVEYLNVAPPGSSQISSRRGSSDAPQAAPLALPAEQKLPAAQGAAKSGQNEHRPEERTPRQASATRGTP